MLSPSKQQRSSSQGGGWCEYVKQRQCEFPCTCLLLLLCSLKPHRTVLYLEMCRCEAASAAAGAQGWSGHFHQHSCARLLPLARLTAPAIVSGHMTVGAAHSSRALVTCTHRAASLRTGWGVSVTLKYPAEAITLNLHCK